MTDLKRYADSMVVLPRKMTVDMINAWFAADRADKPVSECWDAAVEAFEKKKKDQTLYVFGESTIEMSPNCPFKRQAK